MYGQVPVPLGEVEPVADDEAVLDGEAEVVDLHLDPRPRRLVQERADLARSRAPRVRRRSDEVRDGEPGVDDVLDEEHVLVLDGARQVLRDLDDAARLGPLAVRADAEEVDPERQVDRARQVGREDEAALEHAHEDQRLAGVVARDLRAELAHARGDLLRP